MSALPPKADKQQIVPRCPLSAISGLMHRNKPARRSSLFDPVRFAPNATVGLKKEPRQAGPPVSRASSTFR